MKIHSSDLIQEDKRRNKSKIHSFDEDMEACFQDIKSRLEENNGVTSDTLVYSDPANGICIHKKRWGCKKPKLWASDGYRVIYAIIDKEIILPIYVYMKKEQIRESIHTSMYKLRMKKINFE